MSSNHLFPGVPHHIFLLFLGPGFGHFSVYSLSPQTLLLRVCLEEMESKHRQRRHRHYQQLLSVLASRISTSTTPREKFDPTPSTFRHGAPLRFLNGPVRCPTAAVLSKKQLFIFHTEFKKGKCCRLFFPRVPCWPRDRQQRRTSSGYVTSPAETITRKIRRNIVVKVISTHVKVTNCIKLHRCSSYG